MAGVKWNRRLVCAALALSVGWFALSGMAQLATGSLSGRLTDLYSQPLADAVLLVRNEASGAELHTITTQNGSFHLAGLEPGLYTLRAESREAGFGELTGILVQAGHEARVQAAMVFARRQPPAAEAPLATAPRPPVSVPGGSAVPGSAVQAAVATSHRDAAVVPPPTIVVPRAPIRVLRSESGIADPVPIEVASAGADRRRPAVPASAANPQAGEQAPVQTVQRGRGDALPQRIEPPETTASAVASSLSGEALQRLPVSGRRWEEFLDAAPAMTQAEAAGRAQLQGAAVAEVDTSVNGISRRLAFGTPGGQGANAAGQTEGEPEAAGYAFAGGRGLGLSEAAVHRLDVTAVLAEISASQAAGGAAEVSTERGQNGLRGQAFVFARSSLLGARNPYTQWTREQAAGTVNTLPSFTSTPFTPEDREWIFGFGAGRQLRRDRLFWFLALDGSQRNHPAVAMLKHPDLFFAAPSTDRMQLLGAQIGSAALAVPRYSALLETLAGLLGPASRTTTQWTGFGRLDWNAGERQRISLEGSAVNWNSPGGGFRRASEAYGSHSFGTSEAEEQWLHLHWDAFVTENLLASMQVAVSRSVLGAHAEEPSTWEKTLRISSWGQLPQIVVDSRYGFTVGNPARFGEGNYPEERMLVVHQNLSWVREHFLLRAGAQWEHADDRVTQLRNQTGTYHYANIENFATDALAFATLGISGSLDKLNQHNCDPTGRVWRDASGGLRGLGYLPCYSYYTQTMGPADWHISTNQFGLYASAQWQPAKRVVLSAGMRWEQEQLPAPIAQVANSALPLTGRMPALGSAWGPRVSLAIGAEEKRWPLLRAGYGMYSARLMNSTLQTVLSHTGSVKGDLSFSLRPTDNLNAGGAPPFPYVFSGEPLQMVKPGAVEFAAGFRTPEVHQAVVSVEEQLPMHWSLSVSAMASLARHLPITVDTNIDRAANLGWITYEVVDNAGLGPIKAPRLKVPFYANWPVNGGVSGRANPSYQQIVAMESRANSTYEAAVACLSRYSSRGFGLHAQYIYAHALDWNPNESLRLTGGSVLDPEDFSLEYGTSNLDIRHTARLSLYYQAPWKLQGTAGVLANHWAISGIGHYRSGMPYSMHTAGTLSKAFVVGSGAPIVALGAGINGSGGDNRIYGKGSDGAVYNLGRNQYRYPATWKADLRVTRRVPLSVRRELELMIESFNLLNHRNLTSVETVGYWIESGTTTGGLPRLNFMNGAKAGSTAFGQPFSGNATNYFQPRELEFGVRLRF